jgi:hypothetical protein
MARQTRSGFRASELGHPSGGRVVRIFEGLVVMLTHT